VRKAIKTGGQHRLKFPTEKRRILNSLQQKHGNGARIVPRLRSAERREGKGKAAYYPCKGENRRFERKKKRKNVMKTTPPP